MSHQPLQLLDGSALNDRLERIYPLMDAAGMDAMLIGDNANKFYLTGRIFDGYIYINKKDRRITYFVRRPAELSGTDIIAIRKPEDIPAAMERAGLGMATPLGLELNESSYSVITRLAKAMGVDTFLNADTVLMQARSVKCDDEIEKIRFCGVKHCRVYKRVPHLYQEGMTDIQLQIEIERITRLEGGMGILRVSGNDMELNMGSVLSGANADTPSPYDFALGGAGASPALPVGADGTTIVPGTTVMVDTNGNFNGYMTDMTRTFTLGEVAPEVVAAHQLSSDICRRLEKEAVPGVTAAHLYDVAMAMVKEAGLDGAFMGHRHHAGFIGHGVGITLNELPVLSPKAKQPLEYNNVIAIEPKFVFEKVGAVGIENTYRVTESGLECLTPAPEGLVALDH